MSSRIETVPVPHALFVSRRALCPGCGASLELRQGAEVSCGYCRGKALVERRLRHVEPDASTQRFKLSLEWAPSHLNPGAALEEAACPGCGSLLSFEPTTPVVTCGACGSECRIERRARLLDENVPLMGDENRQVVALLERLAESRHTVEQVILAREFESWHLIDRTLSRRCGQLMAVMQAGDGRASMALAEGIGKMLCCDDVAVQDDVIRTAPRYILDPAGSSALLMALGLGRGACLKPLLDAADVLGQQESYRLACTALWAANTLLERNYPEHPQLADIVLYRFLYLQGPALWWAARFVMGQSVVAYQFPLPVLIRYADDCALERPELLPVLYRSLERGYASAATETDYRMWLDLEPNLLTDAARAAWLQALPAPPAGTSMKLVRRAVERMVAGLGRPSLAEAAAGAVVRLMERTIPTAIHEVIAERKDSLPSRLRRAYLEHVPDCPHLSPVPWSSDPETALPPVLLAARDLHDRWFSRAVDEHRRDQADLHAYQEIVAGMSPLMLAAACGDRAEACRLLDGGWAINEANPYGRTALMFAAEGDHAPTVDALLARGARPDLRDRDGQTALMLAAAGNRQAASRSLVQAGATPEQIQEGYLQALHHEATETIDVLLKAGADPDILPE